MSVLTIYIIFHFVKKHSVPLLGLVINGAHWQQLLRILNSVKRTRMYDQLLKLIGKRQEQKEIVEVKDIERVDSLKNDENIPISRLKHGERERNRLSCVQDKKFNILESETQKMINPPLVGVHGQKKEKKS